MEEKALFTCALCPVFACSLGAPQRAPEHCLWVGDELPDVMGMGVYRDPENFRIARISAEVERDGYMRWTRVEEIMEFAWRIGAHKLGLAFCVGLRHEANTLVSILQRNGFEVISMACKAGAIPKEEGIGFRDSEKLRPGQFEAMCNPIGQALFCNQHDTELNLVLGLCVGHDSLFIKHSQALVTYVGVKDRVLCHNPVAALYNARSYYRTRLYQEHLKNRPETATAAG